MKYASWDEFIAAPATQAILQPIIHFVHAERAAGEVYPPVGCTFAFTKTPLRDVKVVILGQDPYHGQGQAHGLAFSVDDSKVARPPSLNNIIKELRDDIDPHAAGPFVGNLAPWTKQGVLLFNTALTVRQGEPGSHLRIWQPFTDEVVRAVVDSAEVKPHFILWGNKAKDTFQRALDQALYADPELSQVPALGILSRWPLRRITCTYSPHPSPLSADRGFFGSKPFSRANLALRLNNGEDCVVDWRLP